ncbi:hypothetical protein DFJ43DRAFT_1222968 [Lentinula guzmanii]|uniref:Uncharacterized protein n=1 Tax=Lentinula guzmanii TaxID=2804957 RepID=A0AA38JCR4_9AGAR|nr:hypothetical protein DFJ43DRAFT_1222968 [Lentinula guzmanii]
MRFNPVYLLLGIASVYAVPLDVNAKLESQNSLDSRMRFQLRDGVAREIEIYFPTGEHDFDLPYEYSSQQEPMINRIKATLERCIGGPAEPSFKNKFVGDLKRWNGEFWVGKGLSNCEVLKDKGHSGGYEWCLAKADMIEMGTIIKKGKITARMGKLC